MWIDVGLLCDKVTWDRCVVCFTDKIAGWVCCQVGGYFAYALGGLRAHTAFVGFMKAYLDM